MAYIEVNPFEPILREKDKAKVFIRIRIVRNTRLADLQRTPLPFILLSFNRLQAFVYRMTPSIGSVKHGRRILTP